MANAATVFLETYREKERAGIMGEPALEIPISDLHTITHDGKRRVFIRMDTLILLLEDLKI